MRIARRYDKLFCRRLVLLAVRIFATGPKCQVRSLRRQEQRDRIIQRFRTGEIWVLISTDLMARGIDFKVRFVSSYFHGLTTVDGMVR